MNFWCISLSGLFVPPQAANPAASAEARGHGVGRFLIFQPGWAAACSAQPGGTGTGPSTMLEPEPQEIVTPAEGRNLLPQHCCFCSGGCGTCPRVHSTSCGELCEDRMGLPRARCSHFQMLLAGSRWFQWPHHRAQLSPSVRLVMPLGKRI